MKQPQRLLQAFFIILALPVFYWTSIRLWYVFGGPFEGTGMLCLGILFFLGVIRFRREMAFGTWLLWGAWAFLAGSACTIYAAAFMNRSTFANVPPFLIAIDPFLVGFTPVFLLSISLGMINLLEYLQVKKVSKSLRRPQEDL